MNTYETIVILTQKISEEEKKTAVAKIKELIEADGEVSSVDDMGVKKLAYEIKKESEGHFFLFNFVATPSHILELERVLRIDNNVLKYMTIKKIVK